MLAPNTNSCTPHRPTISVSSTHRFPSTTSSVQSVDKAVDVSHKESSERDPSACPDCGRTDFRVDKGVQYCSHCSTVVSECQLERSEPHWRPGSERRLGPQQSLSWVNAGTTISRTPTDHSPRFERYNDRLTNSERSLATGLREIRSLAAGIELPEFIRERASYLYRKVAAEGLLKGRSIEALSAACVFLATREQRRPVTIDSIAEFSPVETATIRHHTHVIQSEFAVNIPPAHPRDFLPLVVSRLNIDVSIEHRAARYLEQVTVEEIHVGKHPAAIAATVVYAAVCDTGGEITQQEVADAADVAAVTISRQYQAVQAVVQ